MKKKNHLLMLVLCCNLMTLSLHLKDNDETTKKLATNRSTENVEDIGCQAGVTAPGKRIDILMGIIGTYCTSEVGEAL